MPLTLVATPGASNANAYADQAAALAVASYRVGGSATAFVALGSDQQIQALVSAAKDLDTSDWIGARATTTQAMDWPRIVSGYDTSTLPPDLVRANIELAFSYAADLTSDALNTADPVLAGIKREKVGPLETEYRDPTIAGGVAGVLPMDARGLSRFPPLVQRLLWSLVRSASTAGWGNSAIAVRSS